MVDTKPYYLNEALANFAKYMRVYEEWNRLRRQHPLKWSATNTLDVFERTMNNGTTYDKMLEHIKQFWLFVDLVIDDGYVLKDIVL